MAVLSAAPPDVLAVLATVIAELGLAASAPLSPAADLRRDLGVDSVDFLDILFALNERTGLALTLETLHQHPEPTRVATIVAVVEAALRARAEPVA
jgi:acyl carrier protein